MACAILVPPNMVLVGDFHACTPMASCPVDSLSSSQVVEPFFKSGMLWETWQHGPGPLPQYCPAPHYNQSFSFTIARVAVPGGAGWYVNQDHSKWGVTSDTAPSCCDQQVHPCIRPSTQLSCVKHFIQSTEHSCRSSQEQMVTMSRECMYIRDMGMLTC